MVARVLVDVVAVFAFGVIVNNPESTFSHKYHYSLINYSMHV